MRHVNRKISTIAATFCALASVVAVGCLETAGPADAAGSADEGAVAQSEQSLEIPPIDIPPLDLSCDPTAIAADRSFATAPGECSSNKALSLGDTYPELFCTPYVVEFTYRPKKLKAGWDHSVATKSECEALRSTVTLYTFFQSAWSSNGTAKYHGAWFDNGPFLPSCEAVLDTGSSMPNPGIGTRWRVAVSAHARNCTSESGCYNDFKRVSVIDEGVCIPE
jgi:hypothetical protein